MSTDYDAENDRGSITSIVHEIKGNEPASLMSILYSTNGFYTGNILFDRPVRPEMGLSDSVDQSNETYKLFEDIVIHTVAARYSAIFNTPMVIMTKMFGISRHPTKDEIEHDIDHFGIEQMLWPKGFYARQAGIKVSEIDPKLPKYKFPKGSWMGNEEHIYMGPMRMEHAQCATFIDRYPLRTDLDYMIDFIESLKPTEEKLGEKRVVTDGGYLVDVTYKGMTNPLRWKRSSPFPGGKDEDVPIHDPKSVTTQVLERAYLSLQRHAFETRAETEATLAMLKEDFVEKWPHEFHHGNYFHRYIDIAQDEAKGMENMYIQFYKRWKASNGNKPVKEETKVTD